MEWARCILRERNISSRPGWVPTNAVMNSKMATLSIGYCVMIESQRERDRDRQRDGQTQRKTDRQRQGRVGEREIEI